MMLSSCPEYFFFIFFIPGYGAVDKGHVTVDAGGAPRPRQRSAPDGVAVMHELAHELAPRTLDNHDLVNVVRNAVLRSYLHVI